MQSGDCFVILLLILLFLCSTDMPQPLQTIESKRKSRRARAMSILKTVAEYMQQQGMDLDALVEASALDKRVVEAIVHNRYTPSPEQRQRLAAALGVAPDEVAWGHQAPVEHVYGHGPQFGRSP